MSNQADEKKIPILMYHSISQEASACFQPFVVTPEVFAEHIAYLYHHEYVPLSVSQFIQMRTETLPERAVILTFDDGFADFFTHAWPVLMHYHFTATLYITTAYVGSTSRWLHGDGEAARPMLTWKQVRKIHASGIECGAHSHTHPQLDTLPLASAQKEILQSKVVLEEHIEHPVHSFAYPYGYFNDTVIQLVQRAGFTSACTVKFAMSTTTTNAFALKRLIVKPGTTVERLSALLAGRDEAFLSTFYIRARTPLWQLVRRSSASIKQSMHKGLHSS